MSENFQEEAENNIIGNNIGNNNIGNNIGNNIENNIISESPNLLYEPQNLSQNLSQNQNNTENRKKKKISHSSFFSFSERKISLETNFWEVKVDEKKGKEVYLFSCEISPVSGENFEVSKVHEMRKIRREAIFSSKLLTYCESFIVSGLVVLMKRPKDNFIRFYVSYDPPEIFDFLPPEEEKKKKKKILKFEFKKKFSIVESGGNSNEDNNDNNDNDNENNNDNDNNDNNGIVGYRNNSSFESYDLSIFFNICLGKLLKKLEYKKDRSSRRNVYYKKEPYISEGGNKNFLRGLKAVCENLEGGKMVKLLPRKLFFSNENLNTFFLNHLNKNKSNSFEKNFDDFRNFIRGKRAIKSYSNELFKIDDIEIVNPFKLTFKDKQQNEISVGEYFYKHLNIKLENKKQLVARRDIDAGGKLTGNNIKSLYVPLECLCCVGNITGKTINTKYLSQSPKEKFEEINNIAEKMKWKASEAENDENCIDNIFKGFSPVTVDAVVIEKPILHFGNGPKQVDDEKGSFEIKNVCPFSEYSLKHILVLYVKYLGEEKAGIIYMQLLRGSRELGIELEEKPDIKEIQIDSMNNIYNNFKEQLKNLKDEDDKNREEKKKAGKDKKDIKIYDCIFLFMDKDDKYRFTIYKEFKKVMNDFKWNVPTQVVLYNQNKMLGENLSLPSNVLCQILAKQGNELFNIDFNFLNNTLVVAYSSLKTSDNSVITSLCVSLGRSLSNYIFFSEIKNNIIDYYISPSLRHLLKKALIYLGKKYCKNNISIKNMFIYRDAVNEKMLKRVEDHELKDIKQAIDETNEEIEKENKYSPFSNTKICFILTSKVCDVKLFKRKENNISNVPIGTLVEDVITKITYQDFYLTSAYCTQGTNSPTHYTILIDDTDISAYYIYKLTYYLTYMSFNSTKSIRIPAPLYFVTRRNKFTKEALGDKKIDDKLKMLNISL